MFLKHFIDFSIWYRKRTEGNFSHEVRLNLWEKYYTKYFDKTNGYNQPSLRIALWESDVRIHTFPLEYNRRSKQNRKKVSLSKNKEILGKGHLYTRIYHNHGLINRTPEDFDNEFHYI